MLKPEAECKNSDIGYAVPHELKEDFNTNHVDSTFMILYIAEKVYYGCFFDPLYASCNVRTNITI